MAPGTLENLRMQLALSKYYEGAKGLMNMAHLPNDPYEGRDTMLPNQYPSGGGGPSDDDPSSDSDGGGDRDDRSRTPMVVGEIPGEVHLEMMNHMTPMDPPFIVEEVVDVEENATP